MDSLRQESLGLDIPNQVHVIGCGGVGSWVAITLAMAGVPEIWLWDGDDISSHNLNRIPLPVSAQGPKAQLIADYIKTLRPECTVLAMGRWSSATADIVCCRDHPPEWMVCTTDTHANRQECDEWANNWGINYIEASAEGEYGGAAGSPAEWATPEETQPGYASVPVWIGPCIQAACVACSYVLHNKIPGPDMIARAGFNGETYAFTTK